MNKLYNIFIAFTFLLLSTADNKALAQCTASNSLLTFYNTNNAQSGIMFDITAINCVTIRCFEANIRTGTNNWNIYFKTGTHVGFETTAAAWTLLGSSSVSGNGDNIATYIPILVNVTINAGQRAAFYITSTNGGSMLYTNGTGVGNVLASDANINVREGTGKAWSFSTNYTPRQFNGRVYYNGPGAISAPGPVSGTSTVCQGS
ncbi:MAG: hypothetical protein H0X62_16250, partial [Bacteroidetes bacterium]|nr:hypothetical protein [Bacteroidota bacterium]